jgi:hypothetical protein
VNDRQEGPVPAELEHVAQAVEHLMANGQHVGLLMPGLAPHEQRVVQERITLADRSAKLDAFITGDEFSGLGRPDKILLLRQHAAMTWYLEVLDQRIARFGQPGSAA